MAENGEIATEDVEMAACEGEKVVTMMDVLQEQQDFEDDANAVLGASDDKECTYSKGYIKRQAVYACLTCCSEAKTDESKRAGVCLACSLNCHENHELVELYTKRNFRCDCGNPKLNGHPCQFTQTKTDLNEENIYNQNFSGLYCVCHRPYPDPEAAFEDEMIQCIICEDWLHAAHLEATVPNPDNYAEMICKACMDKNEFIHDYSEFAVKSLENGDVDVVNDSTVSNGLDQTNVDVSKLDETLDKTETDVNMSVEDKPSEKASVENDESSGPETTLEDTKLAPEIKLVDPESVPESNKEDPESVIEFKKDDSETVSELKQEELESVSETNKKDFDASSETKDLADNAVTEKEDFVASSATKDLTDNTVTENKQKEDSSIIENKTENNSELDSTKNTALELIQNDTTEAAENVREANQKTPENVEDETPTDAKTDNEETIADAPESDSMYDREAANVGEEKMKISEVDTKASEDIDKNEPAEAKTDTTIESANNDKPIENGADHSMTNGVTENNENKRKLPDEDNDEQDAPKKSKYDKCARPEGVKKVYKGATFWRSNFRQKLCTCSACLTMYKDLSVLFLSDLEDTVTAYETLGKERTDGVATQYEKGLEALSSLDRIQQINALTEYNKMRDKLLDFLKSFKDRKEVVKEEDIKAFFAGMKPTRESDGVYFCR